MKQVRSHVGMRAGTRRGGAVSSDTAPDRCLQTQRDHDAASAHRLPHRGPPEEGRACTGSYDRSGPHCAASGSMVMVAGRGGGSGGRTAGRYWLWSDEVAAATSESTWLRMAGLGAEPACGHCGVIDGAGLRSRLVAPPAGRTVGGHPRPGRSTPGSSRGS